MKNLFIRIITLAAFILLFSGCATYQANPRLEETENLYNVIQKTLADTKRSDELLFLLTFSGGGTRAAAMSYGILEALSKVEIPRDEQVKSVHPGHTLLDEVDIISSVSGGSFTAAYYGLHGKKAFEDYPDRFLYQKVQSALLWRVFNPFLWPKLLSKSYNRSLMAADYYDKILFDDRSLGDMNDNDGPAILIQATDIIDSHNFTFSPYFFQLICSSLNNFKVSHAVTASSSFPGAFSGISLTNYGGQCSFQPKPWVYEAVKRNDPMDRKYRFAERELLYYNSAEKQFIHLFDGGVSDNLGLRGPISSITQLSEREIDPKEIGLSNTKRVAVIIVNAQTKMSKDKKILDVIPKPPSTKRTLSAAMDTVMNSSNFDTLYVFQDHLDKGLIQEKLTEEGLSIINYDIVHISFAEIADKEEREFFENLPTSLQLEPETVDRLRKKAGDLLYKSEEFQELVAELGGIISE
jgi:NTE family protein